MLGLVDVWSTTSWLSTKTWFLNVETPETFNCLVKKVVPVTVVIPANVETPETFRELVLTFDVEPEPIIVVAFKVVIVVTPVTFKFVTIMSLLVKLLLTVTLPPTVALVLIATVLAFKFRLLGLVKEGDPDDPIKVNSLTPNCLFAILVFKNI